jgi:hypothetical protein
MPNETSSTDPTLGLRLRSVPSPLPSLSGTSRSSSFTVSDADDRTDDVHPPPDIVQPTFTVESSGSNAIKLNNVRIANAKTHSTLRRTISSMSCPKRRLSRQSSLSWGHRPSPLIGASCFLFLLPIPLLLRSCCFVPAFFLVCVTVSSFLSDHCYTGLESGYHTMDRVLAPLAFASNIHAVYAKSGVLWASSAVLAVMCHVLAHGYAKKGMFNKFVVWHFLWHAVGNGLIILCFAVNGDTGTCWEGSKWREWALRMDWTL